MAQDTKLVFQFICMYYKRFLVMMIIIILRGKVPLETDLFLSFEYCTLVLRHNSYASFLPVGNAYHTQCILLESLPPSISVVLVVFLVLVQ